MVPDAAARDAFGAWDWTKTGDLSRRVLALLAAMSGRFELRYLAPCVAKAAGSSAAWAMQILHYAARHDYVSKVRVFGLDDRVCVMVDLPGWLADERLVLEGAARVDGGRRGPCAGRARRHRAPPAGARLGRGAQARSEGEPPVTPRHEWRVRWRRESWKAATAKRVRHLDRRHDAQRFVDKLRRPRADLAPLSLLEVHRREVGGWEPQRVRLPVPSGAA